MKQKLDPQCERDEQERKPYKRPELLHELQLETHAGSPLGLPDPLENPEN